MERFTGVECSLELHQGILEVAEDLKEKESQEGILEGFRICVCICMCVCVCVSCV